jgi:hypothetical protein
LAEFSVLAASKKKDVDGKNGPMQVLALTLAKEGEAAPVVAEWYTKASTPIPAPGAKLEGELENSQYGWKFRKAQQNGFGGGGKRDPATEKRIVHQHSQDMAIETLKLAHAMGVAPKVENVKGIVDVVEQVATVYDRKAWGAA